MLNNGNNFELYCFQQLNNLYPNNQQAKLRLQQELDAIKRHNKIEDYNHAKNIAQISLSNGYPVFFRGSVTSSLVAFLTGISSVDPIKYNIPIEVFLGNNESKVSWKFEVEVFKDIFPKILEYIEKFYDCDKNIGDNYHPVSAFNSSGDKVFTIFWMLTKNSLSQMALRTNTNLTKIPFDDEKTYAMLRTGDVEDLPFAEFYQGNPVYMFRKSYPHDLESLAWILTSLNEPIYPFYKSHTLEVARIFYMYAYFKANFPNIYFDEIKEDENKICKNV